MDIVELDEEHHSCVCGGGDIDVVKDVVEAAVAAMAAAIATALRKKNGMICFRGYFHHNGSFGHCRQSFGRCRMMDSSSTTSSKRSANKRWTYAVLEACVITAIRAVNQTSTKHMLSM
eukprot:14683443-Ditylum_brightwellii.AAC.1